MQHHRVQEEQRLLNRLQQLEHEKQRLDKEKKLFEAEQAQIEGDCCRDSERLFETFNRLPKQAPDEAIGKYFSLVKGILDKLTYFRLVFCLSHASNQQSYQIKSPEIIRKTKLLLKPQTFSAF